MTENKQQYPQWLIDAFQAMHDCRDAQKKYFEWKTEDRLKNAKTKESRVDDILKQAIKAGIIQPKQNEQTSQSNLFK